MTKTKHLIKISILFIAFFAIVGLSAFRSEAATEGWKHNSKGWWYQTSDGSYYKNTWMKINGQWYYFKANGYMASEEYIQGYWLSKDGVWRYKPRASWITNNENWSWTDANGYVPKDTWLKINSKWYYFDRNGTLMMDKYIGNYKTDTVWYYVDKNGRYNVKYNLVRTLVTENNRVTAQYVRYPDGTLVNIDWFLLYDATITGTDFLDIYLDGNSNIISSYYRD